MDDDIYPPTEDDLPPANPSPIWRHEDREREFELVHGDPDNIEAIEKHIETHVGESAGVYHEILSDLVHIDVHIVQANDERPFHTLITSGMSDKPMTAPEDELRYAELAILLPADWPLTQDAFNDENHYWPIRWLKTLARLPHEYETWVGFGHTIPNGDPPEPLSEHTHLCGFILLPSVSLPEEFAQMTRPDGHICNFFTIVPLYEDEMNFKIKEGAERLLALFGKQDITDIVDLQRANVCRKRRWFLGG